MSVTRTELKDIQSFLTKKGRKQRQRFLAEGVRLLEEAARFRFWPELLLSAAAEPPARAQSLIRQFSSHGVRVEQVTARQLQALTATEAPQGLIGVFCTPTGEPAELSDSSFRRYLVCENVSDPGNLGTLIRSAQAFGFQVVLCVGQTAEPFSPKVVRSSAGAIFGAQVYATSVDRVIELAGRSDTILLAAAPLGNILIQTAPRELGGRRIMLAVGSEADGLSDTILGAAEAKVKIEHADRVESLNVAVAGSILMKEIYSWRPNEH